MGRNSSVFVGCGPFIDEMFQAVERQQLFADKGARDGRASRLPLSFAFAATGFGGLEEVVVSGPDNQGIWGG